METSIDCSNLQVKQASHTIHAFEISQFQTSTSKNAIPKKLWKEVKLGISQTGRDGITSNIFLQLMYHHMQFSFTLQSN